MSSNEDKLKINGMRDLVAHDASVAKIPIVSIFCSFTSPNQVVHAATFMSALLPCSCFTGDARSHETNAPLQDAGAAAALAR